jgi:hypothetical protein
MSPFRQGIATKAHEPPKHRVGHLSEVLNEPFLKECWRGIRTEAADGVDRLRAQDAERHREETSHNLAERRKRKCDRAKRVRGRYLPTGEGQRRP